MYLGLEVQTEETVNAFSATLKQYYELLQVWNTL